MYSNEYFDPTLENDYDNKPVTLLDNLRNRDKYFYSIRRKLKNNEYKVDYYASGPTGSHIRNAITGESYRDYIVGSSSEDLFFKVIVCNGETACNLMKGESGREGVTLFYETPEAYERHQRVELSREQKEVWLNKYNAEKAKIRRMRRV